MVTIGIAIANAKGPKTEVATHLHDIYEVKGAKSSESVYYL